MNHDFSKNQQCSICGVYWSDRNVIKCKSRAEQLRELADKCEQLAKSESDPRVINLLEQCSSNLQRAASIIQYCQWSNITTLSDKHVSFLTSCGRATICDPSDGRPCWCGKMPKV